MAAPACFTPACRLRRVFIEAQDAFLKVLDGYTLADIAGNHAEIAALLGIGPSAPSQTTASNP